MATYRALIAADVPTRTAAVLAGIPRATATRKPRTTPLPAVTVTPANKLGPLERARILALVNSPRFVDLPPIQIYAQLLDEACISRRSQRSTGSCRRSGKSGSVVVSPSIRPGRSRTHRNSTCQVFSWDITKLAGPIKDKYYDCYVMIDIFSRYIVGAVMHASESAVLAAEMMSRTVAVLLSDLEVTKSHSRPRVSNNNPYSESWFKTLKFAPVFPERFGSLTDASVFMAAFVEGYNHSHRHTGLGLNTPADFHYGLAAGKGEDRSAVLVQARLSTSERFATVTDPKTLALPYLTRTCGRA